MGPLGSAQGTLPKSSSRREGLSGSAADGWYCVGRSKPPIDDGSKRGIHDEPGCLRSYGFGSRISTVFACKGGMRGHEYDGRTYRLSRDRRRLLVEVVRKGPGWTIRDVGTSKNQKRGFIKERIVGVRFRVPKPCPNTSLSVCTPQNPESREV